ncbi:hypothetical protein [Paenibacillus sp. S150]|uniref:hypothetical protein n=1 Tax=Paenibacillus sp. S150 TaxID=2749826 RepID=UPI001C595827|nr:hypothetical protein [Paenibacillus sp. S150]MBW4082214.1 hypothetical protein [Paenibacillus sp. S150]
MSNPVLIKQLSQEEEAAELNLEFSKRYPWYKESDYFLRCLEENRGGKRITLIAYDAGDLAGCCRLLFASAYPPFYESRIPMSTAFIPSA